MKASQVLTLAKPRLRTIAAAAQPALQTFFRDVLLVIFSICALAGSAYAQSPAGRVALVTSTTQALASVADAGALPGSQHLSLILTLAPTADRTGALLRLLTAQVTPGSASYHAWLSTSDFASAYGASADQVAAVTAWVQAQGLSVDSVSPSGLRMSISGPVSVVQAALAVPIHQYQIVGQMYYAAAAQPSLPAATSTLIAAIDGLDNLPSDSGLSASATIPGGAPVTSFNALATAIDANQTPILTLDSALCSAAASPSAVAEYTALFQQAAAQGITILADRNCAGGSFPAALADITAVALPGGTADTTAPLVARPAWQVANGLPADSMRQAPDLTASSLSALAGTLSTIVTQTGARQGNVSPIIYSMVEDKGVFTQPDAAPAGTWEPATGLGLVDLDALAKAFPRATTAPPSFTVTPSVSNPSYGTEVDLTVTVGTASGGATPTGSVTFTSSNPNFPSGGIGLTSGTATTSPYLLNGGAYTITATYSGDANYAPTTATTTLTVTAVAAGFTLSVPTKTFAIGTSIAVQATLTSGASSYGAPNGSVTVTPSGGGLFTSQTQNVSGTGGAAASSYSFTPLQAGFITFTGSCTSNDTNFTCSGSPTATVTVPQAASTTMLTVSPNPPVAGARATLTATVNGVSGVAPTGNVQFMDESNVLGSGTLSSGSAPTATLTAMLPPGTSQTLTAVYAGDSNYAGSTGTLSTSVGVSPTTTTIAASATSVTYGQGVTLTITVAGANVVNGTQPTGTLSLTGGGASTSVAITNGTATIPLNSLAVGTYSMTAAYSGDSNYGPSSTASGTVITVTPATATLAPAFSTTTFTTGSTSTLTVTVTLPGNGALPAGSMFTATVSGAGTVYTGTFTINPGGNTGTGQVTLNAPPSGSYTVTIACAANANFTCTPATQGITSTSTTGSAPGSPVNGTLALSFSSTTFATGSTSTLTVTVTLPGNTALPAGSTFVATIQGANGAAYTGTFMINAGGNTGTGAVTLNAPPAGTYNVVVTCTANAAFTCTPAGQSVASTATGTPTGVIGTLRPTLSSSAFTTGSSSTLLVSLALPSGSTVPAGSTFVAVIPGATSGSYIGTFTVGLPANTASGTLVIAAPPTGSYSLQISCLANTVFTCATVSLPITSTATVATGTIATTTKLTASTFTPTAGQAITLTATVAGASGTTTPTGSVAFFDGATLLGAAPIVAVGTQTTATLPVTLAGTTTHSIIAAYSGDTVYAPSNSTPLAITSAAAPATIALSTSTTSTLAGTAVTLTAQVAGSTATGVAPTGSVSFYLAGTTPTLLGTVSLTSGGAGLSVASFTTTGLPAGQQTVYAVYSGDPNFSSVTSAGISIGLTDFNITFNPAQVTVTDGANTSVTATLGLVNGFSGVVNLGCLPQPNTGVTCTFTPALLNGAGIATLNITTTANRASLRRPAKPGVAGEIAGGLSLAALLCILQQGRRGRRSLRVPGLLLALLALVLSANLGCASQNFEVGPGDATESGTPLGTSILTVTAAGSNGVNTIRHIYYVQLTAQ